LLKVLSKVDKLKNKFMLTKNSTQIILPFCKDIYQWQNEFQTIFSFVYLLFYPFDLNYFSTDIKFKKIRTLLRYLT